MKRSLLLMLFLISQAEAATCPSNSQIAVELPSGTPKGVVVLAHGLNHRPDKMGDIVKALHAQGYAVVRAVLSGHDGDLEKFKKADRETWRNDMFGAYCTARALASKENLPLHFFGYSLGTLINADLLESEPDLGVRYDRMVYLAPALSVKTTSYLVKALGIFGDDFLVPSVADPAYRASCDGTPMAAYNALFDSVDRMEGKSFERSREIPTLVLMDPSDEMVSWKGLRELAEHKKLPWTFVPVSNYGATMKSTYHHMIASEEAVGAHVWEKMMDAVRRHFAKESVSTELLDNRALCGQDGKPWRTPLNPRCDADFYEGCSRAQYECAPLR